MKFTEEEEIIIEEFKQKAIKKIIENRKFNTPQYKFWKKKMNQLYIEYSDLVSFQCNVKNPTLINDAIESGKKKWKECENWFRKCPK